MSTTLLYHSFGVRGYTLLKTEYEAGVTCFHIEQPRERYCCPTCKSTDVHAQGYIYRSLLTVPIGLRQTFLMVKVPRVYCWHCHTTRQVKLHFADPRRSYTHAFERFAWELSKATSIQDAARHLGVSWDIIKEIQQRNLHRRFGRPKLKNLTEIAIDEISVGKGHAYLTVVMDLLTGAIVYVGDGKNAKALEAFWRRLRWSRAKIKAVATDMSKAYIAAIEEHLPNAVHVFDHFHVVKLFNEKLSAFRRDLYYQMSGEDQRILKGTRWLLLKNPENLDPKRNEKERLQEALDLNTPLTLAYYLKEDLRQIWDQPNKRSGRRFLFDWIARAKASKIDMLIRFAKTLTDHAKGILAYYDYPISTGPLEGTNNKIKTLNRQAYGYRDRAFFKLKILALHQTKYALVG
jgi:transposase